ncbi:PfkB family carbohydrate kinase [uncultured Bifidobacterium sp.]|uniref:PfkB family carbohydrate kinase n=1 Tax=uncultured Bifidobacterium sp. TaxID=165187 RepID=UPI0028DB3778|nr:PfkB family carbohydrate kinase [uncultured Bifidobacterium sp.]
MPDSTPTSPEVPLTLDGHPHAQAGSGDLAADPTTIAVPLGGTHKAGVISLGQIWVDIMMSVAAIPPAGGFSLSNGATATVGGSFRVLLAARRMGSPALHAGIIGTGTWGSGVRAALARHDISHIGQDRLDADTGFRLVLNDGERKTFIATFGAEAQGGEDAFDTLDPAPGDVVHVSGNTLMDHAASGVEAFLRRGGGIAGRRPYLLVLNPTRSLHLVSDHLLENTVLARPIWSCNRQEAETLAERLGVVVDHGSSLTVGGGFDKAMEVLCEALGSTLRAPLVLRAGAGGAWVREPGGMLVHVPGFPTKPIHTRSAGGCHTGVMCAMLAQGWSLIDAVRIANAAASQAIERSIGGVPDCPDRDAAVALAEGRSDD